MPDAFDQLDESKQPAGGGDYAPWWNDDNFDREEGDQLIGVVVEKHAYTDPGGGDHPVATLKMVRDCALPEEAEVATPTHTTVTDIVERIGVGDLLLLEFTGTIKSNKGRDTNTYEYSVLTEEEWNGTEQADTIQEIWDSWDPDSSSDAETDTDDTNALSFAEDAVAMHGGSLELDELDNLLNEVRDYDVDVESVVELSDKLSQDGDDVVA